MEKVVYILGAGFSAPLGLPVMNNFLLKAKDMYAADARKYAHFAEVFNKINSMAVAKSYYEADLFNIEEILSILEMTERLAGGETKTFVNFLCDVIDYYTPDIPTPEFRSANWYDTVLGQWNNYFTFACSLLGIRLWLPRDSSGNGVVDIERLPNRTCEYSVISLNYDVVLELMAEAVNNMTEIRNITCAFSKPSKKDELGEQKIIVPLAKLHGSAKGRHVIAPTWNKGLESDRAILEAWRLALDLLRTANHIRVIGYSLPESDAYIRYLLKAGTIDAPHLKSFDLICSDSSGRTHERYDAFVTFKYARLTKGRTEAYLKHVSVKKTGRSMAADYDGLETAHREFMADSSRAF
jgi:hypothetical protein